MPGHPRLLPWIHQDLVVNFGRYLFRASDRCPRQSHLDPFLTRYRPAHGYFLKLGFACKLEPADLEKERHSIRRIITLGCWILATSNPVNASAMSLLDFPSISSFFGPSRTQDISHGKIGFGYMTLSPLVVIAREFIRN